MDKIIVGLKRVVDYNVRVQVKSDGSGVETDGVKMSINPFDEIALEEALANQGKRCCNRSDRRFDRYVRIPAAASHGPRDGGRPRHPGDG